MNGYSHNFVHLFATWVDVVLRWWMRRRAHTWFYMRNMFQTHKRTQIHTHSLLCTDAEPWNAQSPIHIHIHIRTDTNRIQQINCIKNEII